MLQCPRCDTAGARNYLLHDVLTAKFKIHTPFNHFSHYLNYRPTLPARTQACAPSVCCCQPLQMAVGGRGHCGASLDSLRQSRSFQQPPLCSHAWQTQNTQHARTHESKNTVMKTNGVSFLGTFVWSHNFSSCVTFKATLTSLPLTIPGPSSCESAGC